MTRPGTPEARPDLWSALAAWAETTPGAPAIQSGETSATFAELAASAAGFAARLARLPGPPARPVAIEGPLSIDRVAAAIGAIASGRAAVLLDADLPPGQRERLLAETGAASPGELDERGPPDVAAPVPAGLPEEAAAPMPDGRPDDVAAPVPAGQTVLLWPGADGSAPVLQADLTDGTAWLAAE